MNADLNKLVALGIQVDSEDKITDEVRSIADALCDVDAPTKPELKDLEKLRFGIVLGIYGVKDIENHPVDCILAGVNYLAKNYEKYRTTAAYRTFLREWVQGWQLADEWEDRNTGAEPENLLSWAERSIETVEATLDQVDTILTTPPEPAYFEPGRHEGIPNEVYHASNGISSSQVKDARVSLMYFHGRHITGTIKRESTEALTFGSLCHTMVLEPEKLEEEFSVEPVIPEGAFTSGESMSRWIKEYNASLPPVLTSDEIKALLEAHNATLPAPYSLGGSADEIGNVYTSLPAQFQTIQEGQKFTATAMKACIKEYNATLPAPLKTTGSRDALLEQLEIFNPEYAAYERSKPQPLNTSGKKEDLAAAIKAVKPDAIFAEEITAAWLNSDTKKIPITRNQHALATAIQQAVFNHPEAGGLVNNPTRAVEVSYYGMDEDTGLDIRVRPDQEIDFNGIRVCFDLKTVSLGRIKKDALRSKLHRVIIDMDYHVSAAMYCDVGDFSQFFWIFVNKDEGYHWVAIVEASADLLELGRLEYKATLRAIKAAMDTDTWPAPITDVLVDELNDFDLRRLESLRAAYAA